MSPHAMDFNLYPLPFKPYGRGETPVLSLLEPSGIRLSKSPDLSDFLSSFLFLSYGVTSVRQSQGIPFLSRTVPSAGGLYPCHIYAGILAREDSETGVYYYDPPGHELKQLRRTGGTSSLEKTPMADVSLIFMIFGDIYNSAWKYRDRSYRYLLLDAGHLVQNMELAGQGMEMAPKVHYDFDDRGMADFLGADLERELPLAVVMVNWNKSVPEMLQHLVSKTKPCFPRVRFRRGETEYLKGYTLPAQAHAEGFPVRGEIKESSQCRSMDIESLTPLVLGRRSRRNFVSQTIDIKEQEKLLNWLDCPSVKDLAIYMVCRNWEGMDDGLYVLKGPGRELALVKKGDLGRELAHICLGQSWIANAGVSVLVTADLNQLEKKYGFRGYRYAMLSAGRLGHLIYLGAQELGYGCCGIGAVYDDEAQELIGLNQNSALLYAISAGPVKRFN
jgi:SagB-type dehydrogenase family enzyme